MSKSLLYLTDIISGQPKTYEFTQVYDGKGGVKGVTVSIFDGRITPREAERAEVLSCFSLDREAWAVLMAWVRAAFEAKKNE